ncbi:DUF190 domain-containing protein [Chitinivorax sp. B]|uniref:DUF190 domain-containing protein n=1 Tax=Chitinivorax sp. B TaxID=2502235 RepID=UPI0010F986AB|nr:DUF190 domain-containing protein [Chitinivorax sp. B]
MEGYQLTFFTQQDHRHSGQPLGEWLVQTARQLGVGGATLILAAEGFGRHGRLHAAHFFELPDQPVEVTMAVSEGEAQRLFQRLRDEQVNVFYIKVPIEYGVIGED